MFILSKRISILSFVLILGVNGECAEVKVAWANCVENDTIVTEKSVCLVVDQAGDATTEVKICAGVNVNAGTLVFGGSASSMLCVTAVFGKNEKYDEKKLRDILKKALDAKEVKEKAKKSIKIEYEKVKSFTVKKAVDEKKKDIWERIEKLDTSPFPKAD
ncbi:hypothetical protein [Roseiconus lacunae]|uniref:Uncharacterized protein n=1 Tax=Roseiconus lacunae TaxID=2605694 RepID=A0ABT7PNX1_9BACT|nr:hypothetical protein [Roseiconus lacunae]MDM4018207.1 hypothetical protein [Roseiconus lacunae]